MAINRVSSLIAIMVAALGTSSMVLAATVLFPSRTVTNQGNIEVDAVGVSIYANYDCSQELTSIDWGFVEPGSNHEAVMYIRNEGSLPITLNMSVGTWEPDLAAEFLTVSWNREGSALGVGSLTRATVTLAVSASVSGVSSFSFDVTVTGFE
jgi:hypothetical protein